MAAQHLYAAVLMFSPTLICSRVDVSPTFICSTVNVQPNTYMQQG